MKGVALNDSPHAQPTPPEKTMFFKSFLGIGGASGVEATAGRKQWRNE